MRLKTLVIIALLVSAFTSAQAETIHVPADYAKIQEAIDAAATGDTVLVAPGTYVEQINFIGKAISVKSEGGAQVTTIDGNKLNATVTFYSGEGPDSILDGFTITNGYLILGSGIYCTHSAPTIRNNIIANNMGDFQGAGMYIGKEAAPTLIGNTFKGNEAIQGAGLYISDSDALLIDNRIEANHTLYKSHSASHGGGLYIHSSSVTLIDNVIAHNYTISHGEDGYGGGIFCNSFSKVVLQGNLITGNSSDKCGGGIYADITCTLSTLILINNVFSYNHARWAGGAIFVRKPISAVVTNNVIVKNRSDKYGGGVYWRSNKNELLVNNTILDNEGCGIHCPDGYGVTIANSILRGNVPHQIDYAGDPRVYYSNVQGG
ncbi:MAG: right-handed parallel beta-helix repeat-containing protein, partial [Planctomycetota bacterium]